MMEAKELTKITHRSRWREIMDGSDFHFQWPDSVSTDVMPHEVQFWHSQNTFARIDHFTQPLKGLPEVLSVFFWGCTGYQKVVA